MSTSDLELPISLDKLRQILRDHGVIQASVFGSYARGEQTPKSDLDLFVRCRPGVSLFDVFDLQAELEQQAGVAVDLVTKINPHFSEYIEPDLVDIEV
jgi:predicted nucleotidyltransferase